MSGRYHDLFAQELQVASYTSQSLMALCPFHGDTDASLSVDTRKGLYYCFGCKEHGNYKQFTQRLKVEERAVPPPSLASTAQRLRRMADDLDQPDPSPEVDPDFWMGTAAGLAWANLRGIGGRTVTALQLGYDPLVHALTIPVRHRREQEVWTVRRNLGDGVHPKYRYPRGYPRSSVFIGEHWDHPATHEAVVLVEGPIDAIATWQAVGEGRLRICGLGGSDLADGQLGSLKGWGLPVVVMMDGDDPGKKASDTIASKLRDIGLKSTSVRLSGSRDPGDYRAKTLRTKTLQQANLLLGK